VEGSEGVDSLNKGKFYVGGEFGTRGSDVFFFCGPLCLIAIRPTMVLIGSVLGV
jgi:hypothetical protein